MRTILLVDDNEDVRELLTFVLDSAGYHVIAAADGDEALDRLRNAADCGLILLDLHMPRLVGAASARSRSNMSAGSTSQCCFSRPRQTPFTWRPN
jgi:CheY-like chemotaxis protein